jgi:hypothetical protein
MTVVEHRTGLNDEQLAAVKAVGAVFPRGGTHGSPAARLLGAVA